MIHGFDVYRMYLAMKQHFSNPNYDFFQYDGKVNAKEETYQQRNDFWFFETIARRYQKNEIQDFLLASFVRSPDPSKVWIGDIKRLGKDRWVAHQKQRESMSYLVEQDLGTVVYHMEAKGNTFNDLFATLGTHPPLLKLYVQGLISLETLVIMDMVLGFMKDWDNKLVDPLWENISFKIKKYKPFLSINTTKYRELLKQRLT